MTSITRFNTNIFSILTNQINSSWNLKLFPSDIDAKITISKFLMETTGEFRFAKPNNISCCWKQHKYLRICAIVHDYRCLVVCAFHYGFESSSILLTASWCLLISISYLWAHLCFFPLRICTSNGIPSDCYHSKWTTIATNKERF